MNYYGFGHGVGMSQCGMVGYAQEQGMATGTSCATTIPGVSFGTVGSGQLERRPVRLAVEPAGAVINFAPESAGNAEKRFSNGTKSGILL